MSDIFLSYASEDGPAAQQLSEALDAARCVVVLWSQASIQSEAGDQ